MQRQRTSSDCGGKTGRAAMSGCFGQEWATVLPCELADCSACSVRGKQREDIEEEEMRNQT